MFTLAPPPLTPHLCCCWQLNLSDNLLGPKGAEALAPALVTGSLTTLNVEYNHLGVEEKDMIRKAVEGREGFDLAL